MLDEHGDDIEADLLRFYQVDLLDFYRGTLSARRLGVLVNDLRKRPDSSFVRAINNGKPGWTVGDHLIADLWQLLLQVHSDPNRPGPVPDHPIRAEMEARQRNAEKAARRTELTSHFRRLKDKYSRRR
ncbi:hypothetical protein [Tsukamurella sp. 1534]|uniref:hypothetical protein n=1 Tax=Tsukamurella sp. 1534 TaxID=1151061 RepID=UPI0002F946D4|nr:hypothetical protein [Tsukamurella sp. 1534]